MYDTEEYLDQQYDRIDTPTTSYIVLVVLVAVVCLFVGLAAWTSA